MWSRHAADAASKRIGTGLGGSSILNRWQRFAESHWIVDGRMCSRSSALLVHMLRKPFGARANQRWKDEEFRCSTQIESFGDWHRLHRVRGRNTFQLAVQHRC